MDASADAPSLAQAPSKDGTLPPSPAPRWTWQPKVHALAVEGGVDRPRQDGAPGPGRTAGPRQAGLPARGRAERGSWLATANRADG